MANHAGRQAGSTRGRRVALALGALALLVWGGALLAVAGSSKHARADSQDAFYDEHLVMAVPWEGDWYYVQVMMIMKDDGNRAAAAEAARADFLGRFPGAIEVVDGDVSAQYVLNGYWWPTHSALWSYNPAGKPAALTGDQAAIAAGAAAWGSVGANFRFMGGGSTSAGTGACGGGGLDGTNTVGWAPQSGSVLAVTCTWFNQTGSPYTAVEFDMQIDPDWNWTTGSPVQIDLGSVTTHEFGHAAGLGHTPDSSAVMYASYSGGSIKRTPMPDDVSGLTAIYGTTGGGSTPTATNTPAGATNTPTATSTSTRTPTPVTPSVPTSTPTTAPTWTQAPPPTTPAGGGSTSTPTTAPTSTPTPPATATAAATATPVPTAGPKPSLPLSPGANLVTWPGADAPAAQALGGQPGVQAVYAWDPGTRTWQRYAPGLPSFVNNLVTLRQGQAYWFIASSTTQVPYVP